jgi:uncharacterized LabA/DUF88 family protein
LSRVIAYIDGFNLYYGLRAQFGRKYHWLDLEALCSHVLRPGQNLASVEYFTATVREPHTSFLRQSAYLEALGERCPRVRVHVGRFQRKTVRCRACGASWATYEEKESDVGLAVAVVKDAVRDRFDTALLISADSDLCPAILTAKELAPGKRVIAMFPPRRRSDDIRRVTDGLLRIDQRMLRQSQLPAKVIKATGGAIERPAYWT